MTSWKIGVAGVWICFALARSLIKALPVFSLTHRRQVRQSYRNTYYLMNYKPSPQVNCLSLHLNYNVLWCLITITEDMSCRLASRRLLIQWLSISQHDVTNEKECVAPPETCLLNSIEFTSLSSCCSKVLSFFLHLFFSLSNLQNRSPSP